MSEQLNESSLKKTQKWVQNIYIYIKDIKTKNKEYITVGWTEYIKSGDMISSQLDSRTLTNIKNCNKYCAVHIKCEDLKSRIDCIERIVDWNPQQIEFLKRICYSHTFSTLIW